MSNNSVVKTGIPGLDEVLPGGLPANRLYLHDVIGLGVGGEHYFGNDSFRPQPKLVRGALGYFRADP